MFISIYPSVDTRAGVDVIVLLCLFCLFCVFCFFSVFFKLNVYQPKNPKSQQKKICDSTGIEPVFPFSIQERFF